jgi:predicted nucleic acid-binding protein
MIVVDASVAVKCYLADADSDKAIDLMAGVSKLIAPELIRVEVAAGICRRVRMKELQPSEGLVRCEKWDRELRGGVISTINNRDLMKAAGQLAIELNHPLQDCLYLALAERENAMLLTADDEFLKRARDRYLDIQLLAEFEG